MYKAILINTFIHTGKEFYNNLQIVHNFTIEQINKSIARRKEHRDATNNNNSGEMVVVPTQQEPVKRQRVFLDMLLDLYDAGEIDIAGMFPNAPLSTLQ